MRTIRLTILLLLVLCFGMTALAGDDAERKAILDTLTAQDAAWNRGDLEAFMASYWKSPELVFTSGGKVRRGWQETLDKYKARYGTSPETMGKLSFSQAEVHLMSAGDAWVMGRWDLDGGPGGKSGGIFTLVMRKIDGKWVIVHDHSSSDEK
jgi:ketosteroid isomerase-like protein